MTKSKNCDAPRTYTHLFLMATLVAAVLLTSTNATATTVTGSFRVGVSASASVLAYADDPEMLRIMQSQAGWVFGNELQMAYNMPALQITNNAGSSGNIVRVEVTIGDDRFNFMDFPTGDLTQDVPNMVLPTGVSASATTSGGAATSPNANNADRLILDFGNGGLAPGDSTLFQIKLAFDSDFPIQDLPLFEIANAPSFQRVLFDANGVNAFDGGIVDSSTGDNALVFVTYEDALGERETADPVPLQDFTVRDPVGNGIHLMPIIESHFISGQLSAVPEPTSIALALAGIGLLMGGRRRSRV